MNESLSQLLTVACFESGWSLCTHCGFPRSLGDSVAQIMQKLDCCALTLNRLKNVSGKKMTWTLLALLALVNFISNVVDVRISPVMQQTFSYLQLLCSMCVSLHANTPAEMHYKGQSDSKVCRPSSGLMSLTLAPTAAPSLTPAPAQNDLLETGFDTLGTLPSPTAPLPALAAAAEPASGTPAPSGGFDASSEWIALRFVCLLLCFNSGGIFYRHAEGLRYWPHWLLHTEQLGLSFFH